LVYALANVGFYSDITFHSTHQHTYMEFCSHSLNSLFCLYGSFQFEEAKKTPSQSLLLDFIIHLVTNHVKLLKYVD